MPPRSRPAATRTETTRRTTEEAPAEAKVAEAPAEVPVAEAPAEAGEERPGGDGRPAGERRLPLLIPRNLDPKRLLWLGGLAALAAIEIIEWPVALAIGAASIIAERFAVEDVRAQNAQRREDRAGTGGQEHTEGAQNRERAGAGPRG
ncbi:hypothetical protein [Pseudonocardia acidicola]|uniref:Uncharacterized protein n=1 Tax=Pseudonocardia acidicola TaxID=2724939 RepID=A0ABX1S813_9PSEU|nr:hypothetical protein [Pseudonocardia acidicola]NMH97022.1 hypothetical protein [Pseudonocardia acidicola]